MSLPRFLRSKHFLSCTLGAIAVSFLCGFCGVAFWIAAYEPRATDLRADAAIVLGAAAWGNKPSPVYRERLRYAISLIRNDQVRYLIFTGGSPKADYPSEGEVGREYALRQGVPSDAVMAETLSRTTWENLENARNLLAPMGIRTVLLVSDPLHMRRAMLMAHDLGIHAIAAPTPFSRFRSMESRAGFLWHETWLYLAYLSFREDD